MDSARATSVGFLKSSKVRNAEEAIGQSEGLLTVLRLTQADIKPAEDALQIAKRFFDSNQFAKAFHAAKKAESLAITLDERFGGYQKAAKALQSRIDSMRRLGLRTEELETLLARAEKKVLSGIWDSGAFVPNYLEARVLVERAEEEGRAFQEKAERASNGIFLAELAIESLGEMSGPADPETFAQGTTSELEESLHEATRQLALGDAEGATQVAKDLEAKATLLKKQYVDSTKSLDATETQMTYLRGEGVLTNGLEAEIKNARDMLEKGLIEAANGTAIRLRGDVDVIGNAYRKATTGVADAEILYARLQREGFHSYEADVALRDARRSIREGNYGRAVEYLERALHAFSRRTNAREALGRAIEETRKRAQFLRGSGLSFLPDIQEVLTRAEHEFHQGNFVGSSEDLRIATVLLDQVMRAPNRKN
jgi:tetratricopeptide (TPR) repeat protein